MDRNKAKCVPLAAMLLIATCAILQVTGKALTYSNDVVLPTRGRGYIGKPAIVVELEIDEPQPVVKILMTDIVAVAELIRSDESLLADQVESLLNLINEYRNGKIAFGRFSEQVRTVLHARLVDKPIIEKFLHHVLNKIISPNEIVVPLPTPDTSYGNVGGGISTSRVKGDSSVNNGMIGGDGGDVINSVQNGILHTGGGQNGVLSAVEGNNNVGVVDGGFIVEQPITADDSYDAPIGHESLPAKDNFVDQPRHENNPAAYSVPYSNTWGSGGGFTSSRTKGDATVGTGMIGGDGGDIINSVVTGVVHSGGGINDFLSSVKGVNNNGVYQGTSPVVLTRPIKSDTPKVDNGAYAPSEANAASEAYSSSEAYAP